MILSFLKQIILCNLVFLANLSLAQNIKLISGKPVLPVTTNSWEKNIDAQIHKEMDDIFMNHDILMLAEEDHGHGASSLFDEALKLPSIKKFQKEKPSRF